MNFADLPLGGLFLNDGEAWEKVGWRRAKPAGKPGPSCAISDIFTEVRPMFRHLGLAFVVLAEFPDTDDGVDAANAYMEANPGAAVLGVVDGRAVLADKADMGVKLPLAAEDFIRLGAERGHGSARRFAEKVVARRKAKEAA